MSSMKQADAQPPKAELGQEVGAVESFRGSLNSWIMAYPEQCFSEPTPEELFWLRDAKPGLLDRISASMGRHVAKCLINDFDAAFSNFTTSPAHTSEARDAAWSGAVFERGYSAGYRAALGAASAECRRIGEALDGGGNTYVRYEDAIKCAVSVGRLSIPAIDLETFDPAWVVAALKWVATEESICKLSRREAKEQARLICAMYNLPIDAAMRQEAE